MKHLDNPTAPYIRDQLLSIIARYPLRAVVRQRTTPDRYGFSAYIAKKLSFKYVPRSFANWIHGWIYWTPESLEDFGFHLDSPSITKIVNSRRLFHYLQSIGVENTVLSGLPYSYFYSHEFSNGSSETRIPKSILFVPVHSSEANVATFNIHEYLDYIDSIKDSFSHVSVLIYSLDYSSLAPIVSSRGLLPLLGSDPRCPNSFLRTKAIFDAHDFVSTNAIGSHVLYSMASKCRVSICGPYQQRSVDPHMEDVRKGLYSLEYIERRIHYCSVEYLKTTWITSLFVDSPLLASVHNARIESLVQQELGLSEMLPVAALPNVLGWSLKRQINGYMSGASRRFKRLFSK
jgi:hypothetical protein